MDCDTPTTRRRAEYQRPKYRQRFTADSSADDCPPELRRRIDDVCQELALLGAKGLWTEASRRFCALREHCLAHQARTLDPFDVPIADTTLDAATAGRLSRLGVRNVGQLANVPLDEFASVGIKQGGLRIVESVACRYGVYLRGR